MENMVDDCEIPHYEKLFGNCVIIWKIENFCLASCADNYCIESSEFYINGPNPTAWKLTLTPKIPHKTCMLLTLERLNDSGPASLRVNWLLTIETTDLKCYHFEDKYDFKKLTKKRTDVLSFTDILSTLKPFEPDTLIIRCHLIVQSKDKTIKLDIPKSSGLKCLSEDLEFMYKSDLYKDTIFRFDKKEIKVHKAMLNLNVFLKKKVEDSSDNSVDFSHLNFIAVTRFLYFLYTGNFEVIFKQPTIQMYKCLTLMNDKFLNCYFSPEELILHTEIKIQTIEHLWKVRDFSNRKNCLKSPTFKNWDDLKLNTTWQLRFYPVGKDIRYLSIFADVIEGHHPSNLCFEFGVGDDEGEVYYPSRILSVNGRYDSGLEEFIKRDCLNASSLLMDDTLSLIFKVRIWDGEQHSKVGSHMTNFVAKFAESSYELLSKGMRSLFHSGTFNDISVQASNTFYLAHRCILAARSPVLSQMINDLKDKTILFLEGIEPRILHMLLEYIYSGVLHEVKYEDLIMLHTAAKTYRILCLVEDCEQALEALKNKDKVYDPSLSDSMI